MSNMIRINSKTYLRLNCIQAIETEDDGVYVYTSTSKFKTDLPLWQIINMIDLQDISEDVKSEREEPKRNFNDIDMTKQFVSL